MKTAAIISEYNPFHKGHKYQIDLLREQGYDIIFAVMSGSFTQRGECAIFDKFTRAEAAIREGLDFVVELPAPFSSMPAEYFARAGVLSADALGADVLSFGSECGELSKLSEHASLPTRGRAGTGAAFADYSGTSFSSNDILAIEYLRVIKKYGLSVRPLVHKRVGEGYNSEEISEISSATAIRRLIYGGECEGLSGLIPRGAFEVFSRENFPCEELMKDRLFTALKSALLFGDREALSRCFGMSGGLCERLIRAAERAETLDELYTLASTKVYTNARIRRTSLFAILGIADDVKNSLPEYLSLLATNDRGREYLSKRDICLPVLSTVREKSKYSSYEYEKKFDMLYEIIHGRDKDRALYLRTPVIF